CAIAEGQDCMRKFMLLVFGVAIGFVAAHFVNQNPSGRQFFERVNRGTEELSNAFAHGYRAAEQAQFDRSLNDIDSKN
ncbi:MAG: hypothetical protein ACTIJ6_02580, partial [Leucobacter sp.]